MPEEKATYAVTELAHDQMAAIAVLVAQLAAARARLDCAEHAEAAALAALAAIPEYAAYQERREQVSAARLEERKVYTDLRTRAAASRAAHPALAYSPSTTARIVDASALLAWAQQAQPDIIEISYDQKKLDKLVKAELTIPGVIAHTETTVRVKTDLSEWLDDVPF